MSCLSCFYEYIIVADINECLINNGDCSQLCINQQGGAQCGCERGYRLSGDMKTCLGKSYTQNCVHI